jgi:Uma2 family endonuclease
MNVPLQLSPQDPISYPESDGQPMADNTKQLQTMIALVCGLETLFHDDANVFVTANLLWYPVEGNNTIRQAPDTMVVFGRPKGHRGSYRQWEEGGIAPQVVFEILSPGNRPGEMHEKWKFYQRYGVEEYYLYNPMEGKLHGWLREENELVLVLFLSSWVSPRLGVRLEVVNGDLQIVRPDGRKIPTYGELVQQEERTEQAEQRAEQAQQRAEQAQQRAEVEKQNTERLRAQLKALGIDPEA